MIKRGKRTGKSLRVKLSKSFKVGNLPQDELKEEEKDKDAADASSVKSDISQSKFARKRDAEAEKLQNEIEALVNSRRTS